MTNPSKIAKPSKPYPEFPLFPHATNRWCKKIRGKFHYFGPWDDPDGALQKYLDEKDDLHAGRIPRTPGDGLTIADLCNEFLNTKRRMVEAGELSDRTFRGYYDTCKRAATTFGKNRLVADISTGDFETFRSEMAKTLGSVSISNEITRVRMVFKYAFDQRLIQQPVNYGQSFNKPSRKVLRIARNKNGPRMFEADELHAMLDVASQPLKAMILLGLNCGFGNTDVSLLTQSAVNFESGWIEFPRQKTGIQRRCPLWAATLEALREAISLRPQPKSPADDDACFLTMYGNRWVRIGHTNVGGRRSQIDSVSKQFGKLLKKLAINGHRNFYAIRHTFETIGGESKDQVAVNALMGHVDSSMAGIYRERISDERLQAVTDTVRGWLWPDIAEAE